jgi:hypothetical protein
VDYGTTFILALFCNGEKALIFSESNFIELLYITKFVNWVKPSKEFGCFK